MPSFAAALKLSPTDHEHLTAEVEPSWMQGRAAFGGLVAGLGLEAIRRRVGPERTPRAVHGAFAGPVGPGPVEVRTAVLRDGRSFSHVRAELVQGGSVRAQITAALGAPRPSKLAVEPAPAPALGDPRRLPEMPYLEGVMPRFIEHFDVRYGSPDLPFTGGSSALIEGHIRLREGAGVPLHAGLLALFDAWPSPILCLADRPVPASTVSWSTTFTGVGGPFEPDAFWGFRGEVQQAGQGHVAARGELYDPAGRLAAIEEQLVAVFDG